LGNLDTALVSFRVVIEHGMEKQHGVDDMEKEHGVGGMEKQRDAVEEIGVGITYEQDTPPPQYDQKISVVSSFGEVVNASGNRDQLQRQYGLLSICGLALTVDNAWVALGTSLITAISMRHDPIPNPSAWLMFSADNGGPPGVLYELLVAGIYYGFIAASLAEVRDSLDTLSCRRTANGHSL
jgi:hypothetical protein